jgi:hypothetical protein
MIVRRVEQVLPCVQHSSNWAIMVVLSSEIVRRNVKTNVQPDSETIHWD